MLHLFTKKVPMNVRYMLRKTRINKLGLCPVEYYVRINSIKSTRFSTKIFLHPSKWDQDAQRVKGNSEKTLAENRLLDQIKYELNQIYEFSRAKLVFLSAKELTDIYNGKKYAVCTFDQACFKRIEDMTIRGRSKETIKIHTRHHRYLRDFIGENLEVSMVKRRHVNGFWQYLRKRGYANDVANKILMNTKGLFIFCLREGLIDVNPFDGVSLEWENETDLTHLNPEELQKLKDIDWSGPVQKVVDNFLFMCYTGLHISDYRNLNKDDLVIRRGREMIKISRQKTGVEAMIPLHDEAKRIIDKYGDIQDLPKASGKTTNIYLKVVGEKIGTDKNLTNKVARKTFTDMCLNKYLFSEESVAAMLGHSSTKFVKKYGAVRDERILAEWKEKVDA